MEKKKKCPKCGAVQGISRTNCSDCGAHLPRGNAEFAKEMDEAVENHLEHRLDYDDSSSPLYYIKRILFVLTAALLIADLVLYFMYRLRYNTALLTVSTVLCVIALLALVFPRHASMVLRSRRFYRAVITDRESDYIDSPERIAMIVIAAILLAVSVFTSVYFLKQRPQKEQKGVTFEAMEDGSYVRVERY